MAQAARYDVDETFPVIPIGMRYFYRAAPHCTSGQRLNCNAIRPQPSGNPSRCARARA